MVTLCPVCDKPETMKYTDIICDVCNCEEQNHYFIGMYGSKLRKKFEAFDETKVARDWFKDERNKCRSMSVFLNRVIDRKIPVEEAMKTDVR